MLARKKRFIHKIDAMFLLAQVIIPFYLHFWKISIKKRGFLKENALLEEWWLKWDTVYKYSRNKSGADVWRTKLSVNECVWIDSRDGQMNVLTLGDGKMNGESGRAVLGGG